MCLGLEDCGRDVFQHPSGGLHGGCVQATKNGCASRSAHRKNCTAVSWLQGAYQAAEGYGLPPETVCRPRGSILKTRSPWLPQSYMQKLHDLMPRPRKKPGEPGLWCVRRCGSGHEHGDEGQQEDQHRSGQRQHHGHVMHDGFHNVGWVLGCRGLRCMGHLESPVGGCFDICQF